MAQKQRVAVNVVEKLGEEEEGDEEEDGESEEGAKRDKKNVFSWGIRRGWKIAYEYEERVHGGLVFDWALSDWFHIQPGIMLITKEKVNYNTVDYLYIEVPLLLSLKFSVFRINAGPYFDFLLHGSGNYGYNEFEYSYSPFYFGLSAGFGFDIGKFHIFGFGYGFYIGMFCDYGLTEFVSYSYGDRKLYNSALGLNLGVNFL